MWLSDVVTAPWLVLSSSSEHFMRCLLGTYR